MEYDSSRRVCNLALAPGSSRRRYLEKIRTRTGADSGEGTGNGEVPVRAPAITTRQLQGGQVPSQDSATDREFPEPTAGSEIAVKGSERNAREPRTDSRMLPIWT